MIKFTLFMQVCSLVVGLCNEPQQHNITFDNYYDCVLTGTLITAKTFENLGDDYVNRTQAIVKSWCAKEIIKEEKPNKKKIELKGNPVWTRIKKQKL